MHKQKSDLEIATAFRCSKKLHEEAIAAADYLGMNLSQFIRQSITRNLHVCRDIETQLNQINSRLARGFSE